jgi:membrane dipeptidase
MDNVVSSVSGHTSGQIVIYAWAFVRNPEDAHPLLTTLAKKQTDLNGHTPQNGNVMYAQSGEINDYLWGSMRALGFTYEYGEGQTISYLGDQNGNTYVSAGYLNAAGKPKEMKTIYSSVSGSGRPTADVTGKLAFLPDEYIALGYQDIAAGGKGNGINNPPLGGPLNANRRITVAMIQTELDKNANFVRDKVFLSHIPSSAAIGNSIAQLLKANGAVGWVVTNTASNGGYGTVTPGYGTTAFPVASIIKGYAADVHEQAKLNPDITFTFRAALKDFSSVNYQWDRSKPAYMLNMSFAKEYANHVKGSVKDSKGNPITAATLNASLIIEGKIVALESNVGNNGTIMRPDNEQWKELHTPHYDVVGGTFDWSMLPSKQSEYPDKGWDITAVANGRYSSTTNVKFDVDPTRAIANGEDPVIFADPKYQQTVSGVDFVLPEAITADFDFSKVWSRRFDVDINFSTYVRDSSGASSTKGVVAGATVSAKIDGQTVEVVSLGNGDYKITFNAARDFGITDDAKVYLVIDFNGGQPHSAYTNTLNLALAADLPLGAVNRTVNVTTGLNPGAYLANATFQDANPYGSNRLITPDYFWNAETMENYVFDPSLFPNITWHPDGFPMRATYRTPVDHLSELKYLAQTYPDITNLIHVGYTNGIGANANVFGPVPQFRVPLYALEICSNPGVWDGRPATLHQASNHGGEIDSSEMCSNLAWYLCTQYGKNANVTKLIDTTRVYLMPYTNGDGNIVSFRSSGGSRRTNANGVDLNRNWAYRWGSNNGSSSSPGTGGNYRGVSPNSEPETTAISGLYRGDNIISSVSGHTNGQIVIYAWAFVRNPKDGHPLLGKLAKEQTDLNGHTPQNGNVMYAQSGEINDYLWGSMRALGFTYEYKQVGQVSAYLGTNDAGQRYMVASFESPRGGPMEMRTDYRNGPTAATGDVTAQLAFFAPEEFYAGYQDVQPGEGYNVLLGPWHRRLTLAMFEAELAKRPGFVKDKIFMSHVAESDAQAGLIVNKLIAEGAKGWIVINTASSGGGYGHYNPSAGYAPAGSALPVGSLTKGYAGNVYDKFLEDPTITMTFKAATKDMTSMYYEWERQMPAYMVNMGFATKYANHVKGTIKDGKGNLIPQATLNAKLEIEGKIVDLQSNVGNNGTIMRPDDQQWKEWHTPHYDVTGGVYDWSMLPSKQSEYPDKGWDIVATANGRYSHSTNIKFPVDTQIAIDRGQDPVVFADPMYQQTLTDVDFVLNEAIVVDFDFDKVYSTRTDITIPFATYMPDYTGKNVVKGMPGSAVFATINGKSVRVNSLGNGDYTITFTAISLLGSSDVEKGDLIINFDGGLPHSAYANTIKFSDLPNYTVYLKPAQTTANVNDIISVDVMLAGDRYYTQLATEIIFDTGLLAYDNYTNLNGWAAGVTKPAAGKVAVRSVPGMNMVVGEPCSPEVRIVTLNFKVLDIFDGDVTATNLSFASAVVTPPGGVTGTLTVDGGPVDFTLKRPLNALEIHYNNIAIDTHNDSMSMVINGTTWLPQNNPGPGISNAQLDLPKMRAGGLDVAFFGAYTNAYATDWTNNVGDRANSRILSLLNALYWSVEMNPNTLGLATTPRQIVDLYNEGKLVGVPAIEGAYSLKAYNYKELLAQYKDLGVVYSTLCWSTSNDLGEGVNERYINNVASTGGLTALGAEVVKEMNRLGMAVDVSHMNDATFWGVVDAIDAPIFASHSNSWGVYQNARNLKDEQMIAIAKTGGVVQQNFYSGYLGPVGQRTVKELVDHIDHAVKLIGIDHVGLGSDFDGGGMPTDLPNASYYYRVTEELVRRDYSRLDIQKILGLNTLRVIQAIQDRAVAPVLGGEPVAISADFAMGARFTGRTPLLTATVAGSEIDAGAFRVIVDGIVLAPTFDPVTGQLSVQPATALQESFHVVTFEGKNTSGQITRDTKIIYVN